MTIDEPVLNLRHSNVPYAAIDLKTPQSEVQIIDAAPARPAPLSPTRAQFKPGDRVIFNDRNHIPITGTVSRINRKTVTVVPDHRDGHWRVSAALLNHLVDI